MVEPQHQIKKRQKIVLVLTRIKRSELYDKTK